MRKPIKIEFNPKRGREVFEGRKMGKQTTTLKRKDKKDKTAWFDSGMLLWWDCAYCKKTNFLADRETKKALKKWEKSK